MGEGGSNGGAVVLSRHWGGPDPEAAFVTRSLAGALSRHTGVDVMTPGPVAGPRPDGLFDVCAVGSGIRPGGWPAPDRVSWPRPGRHPGLALVDAADPGALAVALAWAPEARVVALATTGTVPAGPSAVLTLRPSVHAAVAGGGSVEPQQVHLVDMHVPVNQLAAERPHNGLGFTDYLLVLSDRGGVPDGSIPTAAVRWITARFPEEAVVAVEGAKAWVWRARSLRGVVAVDTRTDLSRLLAHARATVDLRPGALIARECVESLRFGTPIVVPAGTAAGELAAAGGGLWFADVAELLGCVEVIGRPGTRRELSTQGRSVADERHGDPARFVGQLGAVLA